MNASAFLERKTDRTVYYDHLRILATFAVMILHTAAQNFNSDVNGPAWRSFNFYDSIVRWGVPVFVMISGALFLKREIDIRNCIHMFVCHLSNTELHSDIEKVHSVIEEN